MASVRQVNANRENAQKSTGPNTLDGKNQSRQNSFKHGLAGQGFVVDEETEQAIAARHLEWGTLFHRADELQEFVFSRLVTNSIMLQRAEREESLLIGYHMNRARLFWNGDRAVEAAALGAKIALDPPMIVKQLHTSTHGCDWLLERWDELLDMLKDGGCWSETHQRIVFNLRGLDSKMYEVDDEIGREPNCPRALQLVRDAMETLTALKEKALDFLDDLERQAAEAGFPLKLPRALITVRRYIARFSRGFSAAMSTLLAAGCRVPALKIPAKSVDELPQFALPIVAPKASAKPAPRFTVPMPPLPPNVIYPPDPVKLPAPQVVDKPSKPKDVRATPPRHENRQARRARMKLENSPR